MFGQSSTDPDRDSTIKHKGIIFFYWSIYSSWNNFELQQIKNCLDDLTFDEWQLS